MTPTCVSGCIGCGYCCASGPCPLAIAMHPLRTSSAMMGSSKWYCPQLRWNGQRHVCAVWGLYNAFGTDKGECLGTFRTNPWRFQPLRDRTQKT